MKVSYVIVNDSSKIAAEVLDECIHSIRKHTFYPYEIIVVEGSDTVHEGCTTIKQAQPFNYNGCLNQGIAESDGEYIVLCNNDLLFTSEWDLSIIKFMSANNVLSASPATKLCSSRMGYGIGSEMLGWCIVIHRSLLDTIGKLPTNYEFWYADNAYADLLSKHKIQHWLFGGSVVHHLGSKTISEQPLHIKDALTLGITTRYNIDRLSMFKQMKWRVVKTTKAKQVILMTNGNKEIIDLPTASQDQLIKLLMMPEYCHLIEPDGDMKIQGDVPEPANLNAVVNMYCINLERAQDRREKVSKEFAGLNVEFVEAIDSRNVTSQQNVGFKACLMSHAKAIENAQGDYALIFEDDVELERGFEDKLKKALASLPSNFLFAQLNGIKNRTGESQGDWIRAVETYSAFAYLVNLRYRDVIVQQLKLHEEVCNLDEVYVKMQPHYLCYILREPIAFHADGFSYRQDDFPRRGVYKSLEKKKR